jgi:hypothetical protein
MRTPLLPRTPLNARLLRAAPIAAVLVLGVAAAASAHDMFVKPERFRVAENAEVLVRLLNGTFSKSENAIARVRLLDVSVVSPGGRERLDTTAWGVDGDTSTFRVRTGAPGTYVLGVSTRPNVIALSGEEFSGYLQSDGIPDELAQRRRERIQGDSARERYAKHVKALLQVGDARSAHFGETLGYPAEIVPLDNPYALKRGATMRVRVLVDGQPVANQYVVSGGRTANGARIAQRAVRSDADGIARIRLTGSGPRYVKFIHMTRVSGDAAVTHESKWATLTFDVR